jgi:hypothetical protein
MSYKDTNKVNLQALINSVQTNPGGANSLDYISARQVALLGKGHLKADKDRFSSDDCYKGTISLSLVKTTGKKVTKVTKLSFLIEGHKHDHEKVTKQTTGRAELQSAIKAAIEGHTLAETPVEFNWL